MRSVPYVKAVAIGFGILVVVLGVGYGAFRYWSLSEAFASLRAIQEESDAYVKDIESELANEKQERTLLEEALQHEVAKTSMFERQIRDISGTVGTLEKLSKTDAELLAKYSKVYFLNENYTPSQLARIDSNHLSDPAGAIEIHAQVKPFLTELIKQAEHDGVRLRIASAYRSFGTQAALKSSYTISYGAGANRFSADQGYSEHQLGTAIDFTSSDIAGQLVGFEKTEAFVWLTKNAHRYGFILSYPKGNAFYQYEPWHWRFVGRELAGVLKDNGDIFYTLEQREIDVYLVSLFD